MDSAMIAKISKAREYAQEPERMHIETLSLTFEGKHQNYALTFDRGTWRCECDFFGQRGVCPHIMAVEKVLGKAGVMITQAAVAAG